MRIKLLAAILVLMPLVPALAQHAGHGGAHQAPAAPYAGFQAREASGLSAEEATDLRAGRGTGLALPAELNGYPGPLHALELADRLGLSPRQRDALARQVEAMRAETVPLGQAVIAAERELDSLFRRATATREAVEAAVARGRLRAAHLVVHLATRDTLTEEQRFDYARLRGYAP
jgi:hypothetical protein